MIQTLTLRRPGRIPLLLLELALLVLFSIRCDDGDAGFAGSMLVDSRFADRMIVWNPGIPETFTSPATVLNVKALPYGAQGDNVTDDTTAFQKGVDALPDTGGVLYIPPGEYLLSGTITISKGVVLRGAGPGRTKLRFVYPENTERIISILVTRDDRGEAVPVSAGYYRGSRRLMLERPYCLYRGKMRYFQPGDTIELLQTNDRDLMFINREFDVGWAEDAVGQNFVIEDVAGNLLKLNRPLYMNYNSAMNPRVVLRRFVTGAGIEDLYVSRQGNLNGSTMHFLYCDSCLIKNVESENSNYDAHVRFQNSFRCTVRDSFFHHTTDPTGHGYGVDCFHAFDCLIENNAFSNLSAPMVAHVGSSGNVFGYNYATEPTYGYGGIVVHGHYPSYNLFESNVTGGISLGDYWYPDGPGNTFLRNRCEMTGIHVMNYSSGQNIIGNTIVPPDKGIEVQDSVRNTIQFMNRYYGETHHGSLGLKPIEEATLPERLKRKIPASFYLRERPAFFGDTPWPLIGADIETSVKLPAQRMYEKRIAR